MVFPGRVPLLVILSVLACAGCSPYAQTVEGTTRGDSLSVGSRPAVVRALAGSDVVRGGPACDRIEGGPGADTLDGGGGGDTLFGGRGPDHITGGPGADWLAGDLDNDILDGGPGPDRFRTDLGRGDDVILDFSSRDGDRIEVPRGLRLTIAAEGNSTIIRGANGFSLRLEGVRPEDLGDWRADPPTRTGMLAAQLCLLAVAAIALASPAVRRRLPRRERTPAGLSGAATLTRLRWLNTALVATAAAVLIYALFPGRFDADSARMYAQAADLRSVDDAHSPLLVAAMATTRAIIPGPAILFVTQLVVWSAGVLLLSDGLIRSARWRLGLAASLACAMPLVSFIFVDVNKDTAMAAVGMLLVGLMARLALAGRRPGLTAHAALALLSLVFVGLRLNAFIALAPLLGAYVVGLARPPGGRASRWFLAAAAVFLALIAADRVVKYGLLHATETHGARTLALFDLAGTARYSDAPIATALLGPAFPQRARSCYSPTGHDVFEWGRCPEVGARMRALSQSASGRAAIRRTWLAEITRHPVSYLRHRAAAFDQLARVVCTDCGGAMTGGVSEPRPGDADPPPRTTAAGLALERAARAMYDSDLGRGVYWIIALAACLAVLVARRRRLPDAPLAMIAAGVAASGLGHALSLFFLTVASPPRYLHWTLMLTVVAVALTVAARSPAPPGQPSAAAR